MAWDGICEIGFEQLISHINLQLYKNASQLMNTESGVEGKQVLILILKT